MSDDTDKLYDYFDNKPHFEGDRPVIWKPQDYVCPIHGIHPHAITSAIQGHEGAWCQMCWLDSMERAGVPRMRKVGE